jgi:hypothetical protein
MTQSNNAYYEEEFQSFIFNKTQRFKNSLGEYLHKNLTISKVAAMAFISLPLNESTRIIDLGGGAGIDFFISRELLNVNSQWVSLETLINFLKDTEIGDNFSLYSNSALQYFDNPINVLESLLVKRPQKVAIIRTPFVIEGREVSFIQRSKLGKNGPQVGGPGNDEKVISNIVKMEKLDSVKKLLQKYNYQIVCENSQVGSFTNQRRFLPFRKSVIRTVDLLARRMN